METLFFLHKHVHDFTLDDARSDNRLCRRRDRIARRAARERDKLNFSVLLKSLQGKRECPDRVAASVTDALARVPAEKSLHGDVVGGQLRHPARERA